MRSPEPVRPRKLIELSIQVYVEMDRLRSGDEFPTRVLGAGGEKGKPFVRWLGDLTRLGCRVNEHWHTVTEDVAEPLVQPVRGEAAQQIAREVRT